MTTPLTEDERMTDKQLDEIRFRAEGWDIVEIPGEEVLAVVDEARRSRAAEASLRAELKRLTDERGPYVERGVYESLKSNLRAAVSASNDTKQRLDALEQEAERLREQLRAHVKLAASGVYVATEKYAQLVQYARRAGWDPDAARAPREPGGMATYGVKWTPDGYASVRLDKEEEKP